MDEEDKPFACRFPGCDQRFSNNDHLTVHEQKHTLDIKFPGRADSLLVDQTPTPTRFLKLGEDAGLFDALRAEDLPKPSNPFDVGFKEATVKNLQTNQSVLQPVYQVSRPVANQESTEDAVKTNMFGASNKFEDRPVMTSIKTLNSSDAPPMSQAVMPSSAALSLLKSTSVSSTSSSITSSQTVVIPVAPPTAVANPTSYIPVASVPIGLNLATLPKGPILNGTVDVKQQIKQNLVSQKPTIMSQNPSIVSQALAQTKEGFLMDDMESPTERVQQPMLRRRSRSQAEDGDPDTKRKRFLERNRAAATRCREKRKQWIVGLEKKADDVTAQNTQLQQEVLFLKNEVAQLKSLLLAHKDCPVTVAQQEQMKQLQAGGPVGTTIPPTSQSTFLLFTKAPEITTLTSTAASTVSSQETAEQVATTALASMARQTITLQKLNTTGVN